MIDQFFISHGMTHPDIWMMWAAILNTPIAIWTAIKVWRRR